MDFVEKDIYFAVQEEKKVKKYIILYNPKSGNGTGGQVVDKLKELISDEKEFIDITTVKDYAEIFSGLGEEDALVICGGDGTLNRFANDAGDILPKNDVLFYATGTGNDFLNDLGKTPGTLVKVNDYLVGLPTVTVNGMTRKFINGIGYGIDGYCCEVGDQLREKSDKPINYAGIAVKGLLFHYKPTNARITVDGVTKEYKKVWIAPTMNGRFYGGGMNAAPDQNRLNNATATSMVMYGKGRIKTLTAFPSIFKGEHVKHTEMVDVRAGREIKVEFDSPRALQIDGETVLNVSEYTVRTKEAK